MADDFDSKTLLDVHSEQPSTDREGRTREGFTIRVVQWIKGGNPIGKPQLVKQSLYTAADGSIRPGKIKGLRLPDELQLIEGKLSEIYATLES